MNPTIPRFLRIDGEVRGPCDLAAIRRLVENEVVSRETEAAGAASGPWFPLEAFTDVAEFLPPRRELGFKATEFDVINPPGSPSLDVREAIASAQTEGLVLRPSHPPDLAAHLAAKAAAPANEVEMMVRAVRQVEAQYAPAPPPPPKWRPSRRLKLMVALAVIGNTLLAAIPIGYGMWGESWTMTILGGWAVLYNGGLALLYFTMPRD